MPRPPPALSQPCDNCAKYVDCKKYRLACRSFRDFVEYGITKTPVNPNPTWEVFDDIYRGMKHAEGG